MANAYNNWLGSLNHQVDFYVRSNRKKRVDAEFNWAWFEKYQTSDLRGFIEYTGNAVLRRSAIARRMLKTAIERNASLRDKIGGGVLPYEQEWLNENATLLWSAREMLDDALSKLLFDNSLVLRATSYRKFYFPRIDFDDFVSVLSESPFCSGDLPNDYLGVPLREFTLQLAERPQLPPLTVISTSVQVSLLNSYRQYLVQRGSLNTTPGPGDVVFDCGACIGEISMVFAGLVGGDGAVHLFDPVPLHARYCQLHASLNPSLAHVLHINVEAVGGKTCKAVGKRQDSDRIEPGGLSIDSFSMTSLDDYVSEKQLNRVNLIKMDIEGAEMEALEGASRILREYKPHLAISAYHKPEDLWEIPHKIKEKNGKYKLFFGHHSPIQWESVYYAA